MNIFLMIITSIFALLTIGEKKQEYKKIYSECFFASVIGAVFLQIVQKLLG